MKCCCGNLSKTLSAILSITVIVLSAWLWHRSLQVADYFYRLQPVATGGSAMRGMASSNGALLFGSLYDSMPLDEPTGFRHDVQVQIPGHGSLMSLRPTYKAAALGFGISRGELRINLPFAFMLPARTYSIVYVPYYFIMLLASLSLVRLAWRLARRRRRSDPAAVQLAATASPA